MNAIITSEDPDVVFRQIAEYVVRMTPKQRREYFKDRCTEIKTDFGTITLINHPGLSGPSRRIKY